MDLSLVAAEYLLRARRTLKEAKIAFDDGDLYYTVIRVLDTIENLSKVILTLNNKFNFNLYWNGIILDNKNELEIKIRDLEIKLLPILLINESALKTPSVIIRNKEAEMLLDEVTKIFNEVEKLYDEYHN
ncbi:hypothetical protein [Saccharolobus caldissimus]|uniref:HEPN domain-containing protein n=1 Tax=Saccharolobus caldissimus TaxID=1702097 RepID=A0AAQ4CST7_9CREN|nr:hypothetical protein [Saccharolobus caldissimus]BDB98868.1 hypothetical protein SACC_18850 [Saccharolobus caldissimus]